MQIYRLLYVFPNSLSFFLPGTDKTISLQAHECVERPEKIMPVVTVVLSRRFYELGDMAGAMWLKKGGACEKIGISPVKKYPAYVYNP